MKKIRGFLIRHRVATVIRCFCSRIHSPAGYRRLNPPSNCNTRPLSRLFNWGKSVKKKVMAACSSKSGSGYSDLGRREKGPPAVKRGKTAVYVGEIGGEFERVMVPVIYLNHPLFSRLLRKAEEEFGHEHEGGIAIPCPLSEFEDVKTRIAAGERCRKLLSWKRAT